MEKNGVKMIILYYTLSNESCRKALKWFKDHEIEIFKKRIRYISKKDLIHALSISEYGFYELLKRPEQCEISIQRAIGKIFDMSFNDSLNFIMAHPEVLRVPLMIDKNNVITGYNSETIRTFIPKDYRNVKLLLDMS